jgi:hypothetical protein
MFLKAGAGFGLLVFVFFCLCGLCVAGAQQKVELRLEIDGADGKPIPCRVHLAGPDGKPVRPPGQPFWHDHFVCDGRLAVSVAPGRYGYAIERGPEFDRLAGSLDLKAGQEQTLGGRLERIADLKQRGWWSGDLHVHRPPEDIELLMQAEDLHVAPAITWWNQKNLWAGVEREPSPHLPNLFDGDRFFNLMAGEDERGGGALLYFHLDEPLEIAKATREVPSSLAVARAARAKTPGVWIEAEKPFWWDFPLWLAAGVIDSVEIANNHMCRSNMLANEAWGRPRDEKRLPNPLGNGRWTQEIYYHALDCGFRLPPSAGSASGVLPNPLGYNRVYVHVAGELSYAKWWAGLKAGQCFVTNGPLLLCRADGNLPGHVFRVPGPQGSPIKLDIELTSLDPVKQIEVIQNGTVVQTVGIPPGGTREGALSPGRQPRNRARLSAKLTARESGWFLVRAVADVPYTFRFASTGPFYVEAGDAPRRVSRAAVHFFQDWVAERIRRLEHDLPAGRDRDAVLRLHQDARKFWDDLAGRATAD